MASVNLNEILDFSFEAEKILQSLQKIGATIKNSQNLALWKLKNIIEEWQQ